MTRITERKPSLHCNKESGVWFYLPKKFNQIKTWISRKLHHVKKVLIVKFGNLCWRLIERYINYRQCMNTLSKHILYHGTRTLTHVMLFGKDGIVPYAKCSNYYLYVTNNTQADATVRNSELA